jgi:branched-chain amino acid transport system substrate-binding protein
MKKTRLVFFISVLLVIGVLSVQFVWAEMPSSVKIGVGQPLTGPIALNGQEVKEGIDLAVELINAAGGIGGKTQIKTVFGDTRCSPTDGVNATQRLISQGVDLYIGNYCSSVSLATMPILAAQGTPQIVLSFAPSITADARTPNSVRIGPSAPLTMSQNAKYAVNINGDKKFAAIALNNDYGRSMAEAFAATVEKLGGKVVDFQYCPFGADFTTYLTKVKNLNVDGVLIVTMGNDTVTFTKSYLELGMKTNIYTNCNFNDTQYVQKQKVKPQNLFYSWMFDDESDRAGEVGETDPWIKDFLNKFNAKYGRLATRNNAWGYACIQIFEQAIIDTGGVDKEALAKYLHSGKGFKNPFGNFGFEWCGQSLNKCGIGKYNGDRKYFVTPKGWGDDVLGAVCPPKE